jgi:hypothetical protein
LSNTAELFLEYKFGKYASILFKGFIDLVATATCGVLSGSAAFDSKERL